nr:prohibitin family protein [uncultured Tolumonas sp.]
MSNLFSVPSNPNQASPKSHPKAIVAILVVVLIVFSILNSYFTVDQGERGIVLRFGAFQRVAEPGFNLKLPLIETTHTLSLQTQVSHFKLPAYSRDQQPANLEVSINWHAQETELQKIYAEFGSLASLESRIIQPRLPQAVKTIFGSYAAASSIQNRAKLNTDVYDAVAKVLQGPIVIESVQLENIDFSDAYEQSVEQRMLAEVEVAKLQQNALREKVQAEITVTQAKAHAESVKQQAAAEAESTRIKGEAEASAIKAKGDALRQNPNLVELIKAERWNGALPQTMLPNSAVPFIDVKNKPASE